MKLIDYKLQTQFENLNELKSQKYIKEYLKSILEDTSKPYYQKSDYIGLCLDEISNKIDFISVDIKQMQEHKKKLQTALKLAKELVAEIFMEYGIDKIDGNFISSLTLTKESQSSKTDIVVLDANAVMGLGYVKFSPDIDAIKIAIESNNKDKEELEKYINTITTTSTNKAKIRVNAKKRTDEVAPITVELLPNLLTTEIEDNNENNTLPNVA
ncbi:siphovirus Gp157 family protein [Aliarcobacter cryaerophilus]|uniref:Uncharacterized protein n=1 Tax=Aliarcobacter cryaerophilus TaxID=28198 RepID=A0A2S9SPZ1_9BACT|nr:siphovirus Gp157 family protein [Aliarcobacter cryaerophilus]PRM88650.1 hypothetical protein CJ669_03190 [Aliarcobacter cryaerophilus]